VPLKIVKKYDENSRKLEVKFENIYIVKVVITI
jgi:hypothetical protein